MNGTDNLDAEWLAYELQQDAAYIGWLTINDPARVDTYIRDCDYLHRLETWKKARA